MKEIEIALMVGATIENWYPPNKLEDTTGDYLVFPESMYKYIDDEGKEKGYKWYPDNKRQHCDTLLKFSHSEKWQEEAIKWVEKQGYNVCTVRHSCTIYDDKFRGTGDGFYVSFDLKSKKESIFESLYILSKHLKDK